MADAWVGTQLMAPIPETPTQTGDVIINKVSNGFVVRVGCKALVAKTWQEVSEGLALYWKHPDAARLKYCQDEMQHTPKGVLKRDISRNRPRKARRNRKA